jgi:hypothetical protein
MSSQLPVDPRILDTIAAPTASPDTEETAASRSASRGLSIAHRLLTAAMLTCFTLGGWFFAQNGTTTAAVATTASTPRYVAKNIEDIQPGDLVVAREEHGSRIDRKPVKEVYRRTSYHLRHLTFRSADGSTQTLKTTDEHPFWSVTDNAWIDASNLKPGTKVASPAGELQTLAKTHRTEHPEGIPVFNFQVEDSHTYFVATDTAFAPLLVHNANYGDTFGKLGTVVDNPSATITGFSTHAVNQAITRGVGTNAALSAVKNPSVVLKQSHGGHLFVNDGAAVVLNKAGKVITTYGSDKFDDVIKGLLQ